MPGENAICRRDVRNQRKRQERGGRPAPFPPCGLGAWRHLPGPRSCGRLPGLLKGIQATGAGEPRRAIGRRLDRAGRVFLCVAALLLLGGCGSAEEKETGLPVHCLDKPDRGPCHRQLRRFYYDYPSDSCRMFFYGGCGGRVPFETRSDCEDTCVAGRP